MAGVRHHRLGAAGGPAIAGPGLTGPEQDPAARRIIGAYLAELADQLGRPSAARAAIVAELEDGLWTATIAHHARGLPPEEAARAAVAEFGDPRTVGTGFGPELAAATGRRVGLALLTTGPLVGASWLLLVAATWRWAGHEPPATLGLVAALVGLVLVVAVHRPSSSSATIATRAADGRPSWLASSAR